MNKSKFICKECHHESQTHQHHASHIRKYHRPKQVFKKLKFENIKKSLSLKIEDVKYGIINRILSNNRINPSSSSEDYIIKNDLMNLIENIKGYSDFLPTDSPLKVRVYCILNNISEYPKCKCGKEIKKFNKSFNLYCSQSCSNKYSCLKRGKEFYREIAEKIVSTRTKNGTYIPCDNFKNYLKDKNNLNSFKMKCKEKYGVENPGVLGAYSSKSAEKYIRDFIVENKIDEGKCYFKNGGISGKEYYMNLFNEIKNKFIYLSYDLVVINDNKDIILVLEYNGPWHYKKKEVDLDPNSPATPYEKSKSKIETYNFDILKLNLIFEKCKNINIFWEKERKLEIYDGYKL